MTREIMGLTGLRGIAAIIILVYHFIQNVPVPASLLHTLALRGYLAVDVFFVLSGFVMAHTYGGRFVAGCTAADYREFLLRRVARIFPLYLAVLGLILAELAWTAASVPGWENPGVVIPTNILLIQSWGLTPSLISSSWSISTEMAAYLVFPLLLQVALFGSPRRAGAGMAATALLLALTAAIGKLQTVPGNGALDLSDGTTPLPLMRCTGGFMLGLLAFRAARSTAVMALVARDNFAAAVVLAFALGLLFGMPDLVLYPFLPLIVLMASASEGLTVRVLGCRPVRWLGDCSYAIYLLHGAVIHASRRLLNMLVGPGAPEIGRIVAAVLVVFAVLCLAGAAHRWIEMPARRLLRNTKALSPAALGMAMRRRE